MATKTHIAAGEYKIESENMEHGVKTCDRVGTVIELVRALEGSDESIGTFRLDEVADANRVTVRSRIGVEETTTVPTAVHNQLTEWGYEHRGGEDYGHRDEVNAHVYAKK